MHKYFKNESGTITTSFAVSLGVLLLGTGIAVDITRAHSHKVALQNALDSSTLQAALNIDETDYADRAKILFDENLTKDGFSNVNPEYTHDSDFVRGTASGDLKLIFGSLIGRSTLPISVRSTVGLSVSENAPPCIIALQPSGGTGIILNGGSNIAAADCAVQVHSTFNPAFIVNSGVTLDVPQTCIAGQDIIDNNGNIPNIETGCDVTPDPYLGAFPEPISGSCDFNHLNFNDANITLAPGVYCGGINFNHSNANVHFTGGDEPYILRNGSWNVNGGTWTGDNVTFYFADRKSRIQFNSAVAATFTAPTTGPYEGVFMTEAPNLSNSNIAINDSRGFNFEGIIYLPSREINFNSGATLTSRSIQLVARSFRFSNVVLNLIPPPGAIGAVAGGPVNGSVYISE